jgi:sugar phosphate isomerase/epimerase
MLWGFAGPWYGDFITENGEYVKDPERQPFAKLDFLKRNGLQCMGQSVLGLAKMEEGLRGRFLEGLVERDLRLTAGVGFDYLTATDDEAARKTDETIEALRKFVPLMRAPISTTGPHAGHRFDRVMPLEKKQEILSKRLAPLAKACWELGVPLGIENHVDYYVSDLVAVCKSTPRLFMFLDTGNCFPIGEKPLPAFVEAAPYVIGTHFKDHLVKPDPKTLSFLVGGAPLGEGDVPLRECYDLILKHAPHPDKLTMEIEMICPREGMKPLECLERSLKFIRGLEGK